MPRESIWTAIWLLCYISAAFCNAKKGSSQYQFHCRYVFAAATADVWHQQVDYSANLVPGYGPIGTLSTFKVPSR